MKLKTLKDLKRYALDYNEVKQEAINLVKDRRESAINSLDESDFMEFFNILEEDLK